jgi:hypothetical protein
MTENWPRFTRKQIALKDFWYSQALWQKPGKRQFGDGVVLQTLKHYEAASAADDDNDTSVGSAEGHTVVSLVIVCLSVPNVKIGRSTFATLCKKLLYRRPLQKWDVQY